MEYNACETLEAKVSKALDKLEVLIQHNEADLSTWEAHEYEYNLTCGTKYMHFSQFMEKFREIVREQMIEKFRNATAG